MCAQSCPSRQIRLRHDPPNHLQQHRSGNRPCGYLSPTHRPVTSVPIYQSKVDCCVARNSYCPPYLSLFKAICDCRQTFHLPKFSQRRSWVTIRPIDFYQPSCCSWQKPIILKFKCYACFSPPFHNPSACFGRTTSPVRSLQAHSHFAMQHHHSRQYFGRCHITSASVPQPHPFCVLCFVLRQRNITSNEIAHDRAQVLRNLV